MKNFLFFKMIYSINKFNLLLKLSYFLSPRISNNLAVFDKGTMQKNTQTTAFGTTMNTTIRDVSVIGHTVMFRNKLRKQNSLIITETAQIFGHGTFGEVVETVDLDKLQVRAQKSFNKEEYGLIKCPKLFLIYLYSIKQLLFC